MSCDLLKFLSGLSENKQGSRNLLSKLNKSVGCLLGYFGILSISVFEIKYEAILLGKKRKTFLQFLWYTSKENSFGISCPLVMYIYIYVFSIHHLYFILST